LYAKRELLHSICKVTLNGLKWYLTHALDIFEAFNEHFQCDPSLQAGKRGTEAKMDARAEG
jgi:hypothetical protein